jgi:hypothetical protein
MNTKPVPKELVICLAAALGTIKGLWKVGSAEKALEQGNLRKCYKLLMHAGKVSRIYTWTFWKYMALAGEILALNCTKDKHEKN